MGWGRGGAEDGAWGQGGVLAGVRGEALHDGGAGGHRDAGRSAARHMGRLKIRSFIDFIHKFKTIVNVLDILKIRALLYY